MKFHRTPELQQSRRTPTLLLASALLAGLLLAGCGPRTEEMPPGSRRPAPRLSLEAVSGGTVTSADLAGEVVVLDFWATWCAPCHIQAEILEELYEEFQGRGLRVLSIDTGEPIEKVRSFLRDSPLPFPVVVDPDSAVSDAFEVLALPTVVLLDRQGRIAFSSVGITEASVLRPQIERELASVEAAL